MKNKAKWEMTKKNLYYILGVELGISLPANIDQQS